MSDPTPREKVRELLVNALLRATTEQTRRLADALGLLREIPTSPYRPWVERIADALLALPPEPAPSGEREAAEIAIMGAIQKAWLNGVNGVPVEVRPTAERIVAAHWPTRERAMWKHIEIEDRAHRYGVHRETLRRIEHDIRKEYTTPPLAPAGTGAFANLDRSLFPLQLMFGKRNLCHIESGEDAPAGAGIGICSVPRKHQPIAEAMVEAVNAAVSRALPAPVEPEAVASEPMLRALLVPVVCDAIKRGERLGRGREDGPLNHAPFVDAILRLVREYASPPDTRASEVTPEYAERGVQRAFVRGAQWVRDLADPLVPTERIEREAAQRYPFDTASLTPPAKTTEGV